MVMDAQPSPQNVGREFVRQYYTLLNKAPDFLHRFYNSTSSFVHGGLDAKSQDATLVIGQKQIQNKIQQLNFRDCHAKISQVDSQATLGNGVVVQVTGELSNDGQPMRRFTQTFVLAAQSPKKYYVHNDIFRYQDVYTDDELDEACDRANGGTDDDGLHPLGTDGTDPAALVVGETQMGTGPGTTTNATSGLVSVGVHGHPTQPGQPPVLGSQNAPQALYYPSNVINSSGAGLLPGVTAYGAPPSGAQNQPATQQQPTHQAPQQQPPQQQQLNGLHESLLKNVGTPEGATAAAVAAVLLSSSTDPQGLKSKIDQTPMGVPSHLLPKRRQGSSSQFGDNHQLFLGNIPHHATEEELKTLFSKFGTVVDLRIMSKSVQKMPGVRTPPHYGFITYEDPASVQNCLANMPLYFPENSPDGHKLNVEEKKTRVRGPGEGSGRMNSGGGGGLGNANSNGPRSGGSGSGQSRAPGGQGGVSSNRGSGGGGGGAGQRSLGGNVGGGGNSGNRGNSGSYGQRSDRGNNVGNSQRSVGNANGISNRGFGSGY
uniref:Uncharacterized protein n=1 Tax=Anopheles culicifacies TaxID=139723 RepID=A0A182LYC9_9DIPT